MFKFISLAFPRKELYYYFGLTVVILQVKEIFAVVKIKLRKTSEAPTGFESAVNSHDIKS